MSDIIYWTFRIKNSKGDIISGFRVGDSGFSVGDGDLEDGEEHTVLDIDIDDLGVNEIVEALGEPKTYTVDEWDDHLNSIEAMDEGERAALYYLLTDGGFMDDSAISVARNHPAVEQSAEDYAETFAEDALGMSESLRPYVDLEKLAADLESDGHVFEFEWAGSTWIVCPNEY